MAKKRININRNFINIFITIALFVMCISMLVLSYVHSLDTSLLVSWCRGILWGELGVLIVYTIISYYLDGIVHKIIQYKISDPCPYLLYEHCPFNDEKKCEYDKSTCLQRQRKEKKSSTRPLVISLFVLALLFLLWGTFWEASIIDEATQWKSILSKVSQPISASIIAAILVSWMVDIPSRIREEKTFFVDVLSSNDYMLKNLDEDKLTDLRLRAIKNMHNRDYPKMAEGLIEIDEKICKMLKMPYYTNYHQSVYVEKVPNENNYKKTVKVAFTAQNPYGNKKSIPMNIGMGNNLSFENDEINEEAAKKMYKLKSFVISFEEDAKEWDVKPYVLLGFKRIRVEGLQYNGIIMVTSQKSLSEPISLEFLKKSEKLADAKDYASIEGIENPGLMVEFTGKIHVKFEYEVTIPVEDNVFTKRLRYPARNFHLDYAIDDKISDIALVGQIIGTVIDQYNVIITTQPNQKQITMNTHDWLLQKNGAVVVHCNTKNTKNQK